MSTREVWNGKGDAEGMAWWTLENGQVVGKPYVRRRCVAELGSWLRCGVTTITPGTRQRVLSETVENDAWLRMRHGQTVSSVCKDAVSHMLHTL